MLDVLRILHRSGCQRRKLLRLITLVGLMAALPACRSMSSVTSPQGQPSAQGDGTPPKSSEVTVNVAPQPLELRVQPGGTIAGTVALTWPSDAKVALSATAIPLAAPSEPLRTQVSLITPEAIRLAVPSGGIPARLEVKPFEITMRPPPPLETKVNLSVRIDPASLANAKIGVDWRGAPKGLLGGDVKSQVAPTPERPLGWLMMFAVMVTAALIAFAVQFFAGTDRWWASKSDRRRERSSVQERLHELAADPLNGVKQFVLAFVATLFVPVVLDLLGKSLMKDLADGTWGLMFVFFSYCFIVATFGAGFIFPVMGGFERAIRVWQDRGKWG